VTSSGAVFEDTIMDNGKINVGLIMTKNHKKRKYGTQTYFNYNLYLKDSLTMGFTAL